MSDLLRNQGYFLVELLEQRGARVLRCREAVVSLLAVSGLLQGIFEQQVAQRSQLERSGSLGNQKHNHDLLVRPLVLIVDRDSLDDF